jgi:hypothetical protein
MKQNFAGFDPEEFDLTVMDGYDDCIVGVVERFGQDPIVCYDKEKVLLQLEKEGMNREEAEEWFYVNQIGAWVGDSTPCFLSTGQYKGDLYPTDTGSPKSSEQGGTHESESQMELTH